MYNVDLLIKIIDDKLNSLDIMIKKISNDYYSVDNVEYFEMMKARSNLFNLISTIKYFDFELYNNQMTKFDKVRFQI